MADLLDLSDHTVRPADTWPHGDFYHFDHSVAVLMRRELSDNAKEFRNDSHTFFIVNIQLDRRKLRIQRLERHPNMTPLTVIPRRLLTLIPLHRVPEHRRRRAQGAATAQ